MSAEGSLPHVRAVRICSVFSASVRQSLCSAPSLITIAAHLWPAPELPLPLCSS